MHKSSKGVLFFLLCICTFIVLSRFCISERAIENIAAYCIYPVLLAQSKIVTPIKIYFEQKKKYEDLMHDYQVLQSDRDTILAENIELHSLISYVDETNELIAFKEKYHDAHAKLAQVLVKHFSDQSHYYLVDKGSVDGVMLDMVAVFKNCIIGKIIEVYPCYSKVLLITDNSCKIAAYCAHTKTTGIYEGNNDKGGSLNYVSHLLDLETDDLIISSGDGLIFPKGFGLGTVKTYAVKGLFHEITIEALLNLRKIDYCYIIQKGGKLSESSNEMVALSEKHVTLTAKELHDLEMQDDMNKLNEKQTLMAQRMSMIQADPTFTTTEL